MQTRSRFGWSGSITRWRGIPAVILGVALAFVSAIVFATHDLSPDVFELEGNVADDVTVGEDWALLDDGHGDPNNDDSSETTVFVFDDGTDGIDDAAEINFGTGGSKDDLELNQWSWSTSPVPDKNDIMTAGAGLYTYGGSEVCPPGHAPGTNDPLCTRPGDPIMYFFLDRFSGGTGDADVGFWFFKGAHNLIPSANDPTKGTFDGLHEVGDILVL